MQEVKFLKLAALVAPAFLFAQSVRTYSIDSVRVRGKTVSKAIEKTAYNVNSIETARFKNNASDAKDVLNTVPGVRILQDGGLGSALTLTLNGFSGQQVKVFLDGIPIDHYSSSFSLSNIPINAIERIDVYKGVVPVELGTDALGGVINIITNKKKNFLDASYGFGSFNTHLASLNGAYTNKKTGFTFNGSANFNYSDNNYKVYVPIVENNMTQYYADVPQFHDRYRSGNVRLETGFVDKTFADRLLFGITASADDKQVQNGATMDKVFGGITTASTTIAPSLKYSKKNLFIAGLDANFFASYNLSESKVRDTLQGVTFNWLGQKTITPGSDAGEFSRTDTTLKDKEFSTGLNLGYRLAEHHSLAVNYLFTDFNRKSFDRLNPDLIDNRFPKTLSKGVFGLSYRADILPNFNVTAFTKFYSINAKADKLFDYALPTQHTDVYKRSQNNTGFGAAATYMPFSGFQVKTSFEQAYRMPVAEELFGDGLFVQSNIDLKPEKSNNFNFGLNYEFSAWESHRFSLGGSFLYRNSADLIYPIATVSSPVTQFGNIGKARTLAGEGSLGYRYKNNFHITGNITYQDITDQSDFRYINSYNGGGYQINYQKGDRIPNVPYFFWNADAGYTFHNLFSKNGNLELNYRFNFVNEYYLTWANYGDKNTKNVIPRQASQDVGLVYSFGGGRYNIGAECRDITNERLYDKFYLQKPGRSFFLKLRMTL